jgi:hypothetical protein
MKILLRPLEKLNTELPLILSVFPLILLLIGSSAHAQECFRESREFKADADSTLTLFDYACARDIKTNSPEIRVTFYRLDEALAGSLLTQQAIPEFSNVLGPMNLIDNEVSLEARALFTRFGTQTTYDFAHPDPGAEWYFSVGEGGDRGTIAIQGDTDLQNASPKKLRKIWYISSPNFEIESDTFVLNDASAAILGTTHWPNGYNLAYRACAEPSDTPGSSEPSDSTTANNRWIPCTIIWRYLVPSDFDLLLADMRGFARRAERDMKQDPSFKRIIPDYEKSLALFRYIAERGWPSDFLYVYGNVNDGGCGGFDNWEFNYAARTLALDVAVVENLSNHDVRLDNIAGVESTNQSARLVQSEDRKYSSGHPIDFPSTTLKPASEIVLPLRIMFIPSEARDPAVEMPADMAAAERTFQAIKSSKEKTFKLKIGQPGHERTISKNRESFFGPKLPTNDAYLFGPEVLLSGFTVDGRRLVLNGTSEEPASDALQPAASNHLSISNYGGPGSCPVLYTWSNEARSWVAYGKILHEAQNADKEMTQTIRFPGLQTHLRLAEEELEMTVLKDVRLTITLENNQRMEISPRQAYSRIIRAYSTVDIDFDLPTGISAADVQFSEISFTGYYQRYDAIVAEQGVRRGN